MAVTRLENLRAFMNGFAEVVRLPPPDRRPTDLRQLVDEILLLLRPELDRRRIRVEWEQAERVPPLDLDRNHGFEFSLAPGEGGGADFRVGF